MTAYELADYVDAREINNPHLKDAANMLRQQADRIAELEETINACYTVQKMQAEEVYKGNDRIAELEKQLEEKNKPPTKFDTLMESQARKFWGSLDNQCHGYTTPQTKPLSNAELDIEIVKLVQGKHATMRDMLRAIEERHGIK